MWIVCCCTEPYYWTEDVCAVALTLFKRGVPITEASVGRLIGTLQKNATILCKSSKFAKLVIEICKSPQHQAMVSYVLIVGKLEYTVEPGTIFLQCKYSKKGNGWGGNSTYYNYYSKVA